MFEIGRRFPSLYATIPTVVLLAATFSLLMLSGSAAGQAPDECELAGPDASDYVCAIGEFEWADTDEGEELEIPTDGQSDAIQLDPEFPWYGGLRGDAFVSSKGLVCFSVGSEDCVSLISQPVPDTDEPNDLVACAWEDLDPERGTVLHNSTSINGQAAHVIEFNDVPYYKTNDFNTFQIQLLEDGRARCMLDEISDPQNGWDMAVGIEGPDGGQGVRYTHSEFSADDVAVLFGQGPPAPEGLSTAADFGEINLTWEPSENGIEEYTVYKRPTPDGAATNHTVPANQTWFLDDGLDHDETWFYEVSATDDLGEGPLSEQVNDTTLGVPSAPQALDASPGLEEPNITLEWSPPEHANATSEYRIYKNDTTGDENEWIANVSAGETTWTDSNNTPGIQYTYNVTAANQAGESTPSNDATSYPAGPIDAPDAPENLEANPGDTRPEIDLTWQPPSEGEEVAQYHIYKNDTTGDENEWIANVSAGETTWTDSNNTAGIQYTYNVTAANAVGESEPSDNATSYPAGPTAPPNPPENLEANPGPLEGSIMLSWDEVDDPREANWIHVYRNASPKGTVEVANISASETDYVEESLSPGTAYQYNITLVNVVGESDPSNNATSVPAGPPGAPAPVVASQVDNLRQIALDWSEPEEDGGADVTHYDIYRSVSNFPGAGHTTLAYRASVDAPTEAFSDAAGIDCAREYRYVVHAANEHGNGPGTEASALIEDGCLPEPTEATATPGDNDPETHPTDSILVDWEKPDTSEGIASYEVFYCDALEHDCPTASSSDWESVVVTEAPFMHENLQPGASFTYTIAAIDGDDDMGFGSDRVSATIAEAPGAPQNAVAASEPTSEAVEVTWEEPGDDGGAELESYHVYRGTGEDDLARIATVAADQTQYQDQPPEPGEWCYAVSANNTFEGPTSSIEDDSCATFVGVAQPSADCTDLFATIPLVCPEAPQDLQAQASLDAVEIELNWSAPETTVDQESEVIAYRVYQGAPADEGCVETEPIEDVSGTEYTTGELDPDQTYCYHVTAIRGTTTTSDLVPLEGPSSNSASAQTLSAPGAPVNLDAAPGGAGEADLTWAEPENGPDSPIDEYVVYRAPTNACDTDQLEQVGTTAALDFLDDDDGLGLPESAYCYAVSAQNAAGESPLSDADTVDVENVAPQAPGDVSAEADESESGTIDVQWDEPIDGEDKNGGSPTHSYVIYRQAEGGSWAEVETVSVDEAKEYTDEGLAPGIEFCYRVTAVNTALDEDGNEVPGKETPFTEDLPEDCAIA